jgi:ankyrin repeat protein
MEQREIIQVFPASDRLNDKLGWLPLHWALACGNTVTEEDVKTIYSANPMALSTRHLISPMHGNVGFTSISLLLMAKRPNMSLLLFFLKTHPEALNIPVGSFEQSYSSYPLYPLHFAAAYSESVEVLQMLLQVNANITSMRTNSSGEFPLGLLCRREEFPGFWVMVSCLLKEDCSDAVVENAISCVIKAKGLNTLPLIQMLLAANLDAARCVNVAK